MANSFAEVQSGELFLPRELAVVMRLDGRDRLLIEREEGGPMVSRHDLVRLVKRRLRRRPVNVVRCRESPKGWTAECPEWLRDGIYRVVNYAPRFMLIRSDTQDEAADRATYWASILDYHEHRPPDRQDATARLFSDWFASSVIAPLAPKRVLEIGCGAGRNLAQLIEMIDGVEVAGVEINPQAAEQARAAIGGAGTIVTGSLYDIRVEGLFDVVFTAGVLMHVPHGDVDGVVRSMVDLATKAVVHFELHGEPHGFDFHRYPRNYLAVYEGLGLAGSTYRVLDRSDPLNAGESVGQMALLTYRR